MFTWMRTHQRKLMIVVTFLTIIAFVVLYNTAQLDQIAEGQSIKLYGRDVPMAEIQKSARMFSLALALGLTEYASMLDGAGGEASAGEFAFNTMVLRHEARQLGIEPTIEEIKNAITAMPAFQTNGQFDPAKYETLVQTALGPQGFTVAEIEESVRNSLKLQRILKIVESAPTVTDDEVAYTARAFQKTSGIAVTFDLATYLPKVEFSDNEIEAAYAIRQPQLMTPELRSVRYVTFELSEEQKKLEGKARIDALQAVADASSQFAEAAATSGFTSAAESAGLEIKTTLDFDRSGNVQTPEGAAEPATNLAGPIPVFAPAASLLTKEQPVSGVIQNGDQFFVLELAGETASRQLTLEETREELSADVRRTLATATLEVEADDAMEKIRTAIKGGQSFADAAAAAGVTTRPFTEIAPLADTGSEQERAFADATLQLKDGEISGYVSQPEGGFFTWLEKRSPVDEAEFAERKEQIADYILSRKQSILFFEWLEFARENAGLVMPGDQ